MFGRYTERAHAALTAARETAERLHEKCVGTEHLLVGLLHTMNELPAEIASHMDEKKVMDILLEGRPDPDSTPAETVSSFSPRMKKLLEQSFAESKACNQTYVSAEHFWLALLKLDDSKGFSILSRLGVDPDRTRQQLLDMLAQGSQSTSSTPTPTSNPPSPAGDPPQPVNPEEPRENISSPRTGSTPSRAQGAERRGGQSGGQGLVGNTLRKFTIDLTSAAENHELDPCIGREKEIQRMIQILIRRTKNNPVLVGDAGVGKTAVVEGLAQRIAAGNVPEMLMGKRVLQLDLTAMLAGTHYRGDFEDRIKHLLEDIQKNGNILLFIDEMHMLMGAGESSEGTNDAANMLKPALSRGALQCIGCTTVEEFRKHIEKDKAMARRFQSVLIDEPSTADAEKILLGLRDRYESHHRVQISDEAIHAAVHLSSRYITDRFLPDKAVDLMDEAASRIRISAATAPPEVKELENQLEAVVVEKREAISRQDFEKAAAMRDQESQIRAEVQKKRESWSVERTSDRGLVTEQDIAAVVSEWTGIPVNEMSSTDIQRLTNLEEQLHERVIGQNEAVSAIARAIRRSRAGLKDPNRPIGSFLFLGPTGVGKTELCKALGAAVFGSESAVIRLDMSEYMEKISVTRLIGSAPGYVGYEEGGQLTEAVRRKPYSVVLLDEIEKAHPDVFNILLQVMDDGRLTDGQGRTVSFKNTIIVMTSNTGARELEQSRALGFGSQDPASEDKRTYDRMQAVTMKAVKDRFAPEFINRVDEMIVFHSLTQEDIRQIAELMLKQLANLLKERGSVLTWDQQVVNYLAKEGYDPKYGARPLRRLIQRRVEDLLSEELIAGHFSLRDQVALSMRDENTIVVTRVADTAVEDNT
ncbi:MAG: ATP-dependent Clp protease ATP-binding subunit [Clostridia bacterium]|nr:ATP-dependent Clp protease ATP-binding subunit [Clostridia bacterium]